MCDQLQLLGENADPTWTGRLPPPKGDGWIWVHSVEDLLARFNRSSWLEINTDQATVRLLRCCAGRYAGLLWGRTSANDHAGLEISILRSIGAWVRRIS